jgi:hypothetical protein
MLVTSSITLGADSPFCAGQPGLVVGADGVTINLNGHRLSGDRSAGPIGIDVLGHTGVTIKNGVVRGFDRGIVSAASSGLKITNVEVRDSRSEGALLDGAGIAISKSVFVANSGDGLHLGDGTPAPKISASFFVGTGGDGLDSQAARLAASKLVATLNDGSGVVLAGAEGASLKASTLAATGAAGVRIQAPLPAAAVTTNLAGGNSGDGIALAAQGSGYAIGGNTVGGNGGHGIAVLGTSSANATAKNTAIGNSANGVFVDTAAGATTVAANRAIGNGGYGIAVDVAAGTLAKNVAIANVLSGITTPFGATDGGGNKARDNAVEPQCGPPISCP